MTLTDIVLPILIAAAASIYAMFAGRAQSSRLRGLHQDFANGKLRGYLTISVVPAVMLASHIF